MNITIRCMKILCVNIVTYDYVLQCIVTLCLLINASVADDAVYCCGCSQCIKLGKHLLLVDLEIRLLYPGQSILHPHCPYFHIWHYSVIGWWFFGCWESLLFTRVLLLLVLVTWSSSTHAYNLYLLYYMYTTWHNLPTTNHAYLPTPTHVIWNHATSNICSYSSGIHAPTYLPMGTVPPSEVKTVHNPATSLMRVI